MFRGRVFDFCRAAGDKCQGLGECLFRATGWEGGFWLRRGSLGCLEVSEAGFKDCCGFRFRA